MYLLQAECVEQVEQVVDVVLSDQCSRSDYGLLSRQLGLEVRVGGQRPEEPGQSVDITALFQRLTDSRHLLGAQQRPRRQHAVPCVSDTVSIGQHTLLHSSRKRAQSIDQSIDQYSFIMA